MENTHKTLVQKHRWWMLIFLSSLVAILLVGEVSSTGSNFETNQASAATISLPTRLLHISDLVYERSFALPSGHYGGVDDYHTWSYRAPGIVFNPARNSLIGAGHTSGGLAGEASIPVPGAKSVQLQPFGDPTDGKKNTIGSSGNPIYLGGFLIYNGRLITTAWDYYDAGFGAKKSHFTSELDLSINGDVNSPITLVAPNPGYVAKYMALVPQEWQAAIGKPAVTGMCCESIISRTSYGPDLFAFDPDDLGKLDPVPTTPLFYYPQAYPLREWNTKNSYFNGVTRVEGVVWPSNSRTVMFFGRHSTGDFCYGPSTSNPAEVGKVIGTNPYPRCYDPAPEAPTEQHSTHAYPILNYVWLYDANDFVAVKNGTKNPWDVMPYEVGTLNGLPLNKISGATYDPVTGKIFISGAATSGGADIYIYSLGSGGTPPPTPPLTPTPTPTSVSGPNTRPIGYADGIGNGIIYGWSYDPDNAAISNSVHIYVDGPAGGGGTFLASTVANQPRPDVNQVVKILGNHGIEFTVPSNLRDDKTHTAYLYGIDLTDPANNNAPLIYNPVSFRLTTFPTPTPIPTPSATPFTTPTPTGVPGDHSACIGITAPSTVTAGQTFSATVTMNNTGGTTWDPAVQYKLGSQNPQDNSIWGTGRALFSNPVGPGGTVNITFNPTAPSSPDTYSFDWKMLQETVRWFGVTCTKTITVVSGTTPTPTPTTPTPTPTTPTPTPTTPTPTPATNTLPIGYFDGLKLDGVTLYGWSYDPDFSSFSSSLHLYVDGPAVSPFTNFASSITANLSSPDVNSVKGISGNHRFEYVIPTFLRDGKPRTYYIYAIDTDGGTNPQITTSPQTFTVQANVVIPTPTPTVTTILSTGAGRLDWSPSGNIIVFDRLGADNFYDIYTMTSEGTNQVCLTCDKPALASNKHIGNPSWHPAGSYIVFQAQNDYFGLGSITDYFANPGSGVNNDLWIMNSSGTQFWKLVDVPNAVGGILHPHFSHNGNKLFWSQRISSIGSVGTWALKVADFSINDGIPVISNIQTYQPGNQILFYESHGFTNDDKGIIFSGPLETGQAFNSGDIYVMDLATQQITNLTNTMNDWDEHAQINPINGKIVWMTSSGYQNSSAPPTDYWIMDSNGTNKTKITHFNEPGYLEYMNGQKVVAADNAWNPSGTSLMAYLILDVSIGDSRIVRIDFPTPTTLMLSPASSATAMFSKNLYYGKNSSDVISLQNYLISKGYLQAGKNTGFFGNLTLKAVKLFQSSNGIKATGYFGILSRAIAGSK